MSVIETAKRKMDEVDRAIAYRLPGYSKSDMAWWCAYIEGAEDQKREDEAASTWHRVEDELPNDGEWAIFTNGKVVTVERFKVDAYNHFFPASQWFDFEDAIAWMPLPEPPKEDA